MKKRILAFGMATCLALSTATVAFAADETAETSATIGGTGSIEGYVEKDMFVFTAPTTSDVNFKIDPQELLRQTNQADKLDGAALAEGYGKNVMFSTATANEWATESQNITVVNKGQFDIDVTVNATVTGLTKAGNGGYDIQMAEGDVSSYGDKTAIAIQITPSTSTLTDTTEATKTPITSDAKYLTADAAGVTVKQKVAAAPDTAFEIVKEADGSYKYAFVSDLTSVAFDEVIFNLSGTVNTAANWKNFNSDADKDLKVELTYTVEQHLDVETVTDVIGEGKGFSFTVLKSDLEGTPTTLYVYVGTKWHNLAQYSSVAIDDKGKYYEVTVANWPDAPADGSRPIRLSSANTTLYDGTVTFTSVKTITDIAGVGDGFSFTVLKSDLSDTPEKLSVYVNNKWHDLSNYATVDINAKSSYYEVTVSGWSDAPASGSRNIKLTTAADDNTELYTGIVTFGQ